MNSRMEEPVQPGMGGVREGFLGKVHNSLQYRQKIVIVRSDIQMHVKVEGRQTLLLLSVKTVQSGCYCLTLHGVLSVCLEKFSI